MIHHLVFWKMKPLAEGRTGKENAEILAQKLSALKSIISGAAAVEAGVNFNPSPNAYDAGLHTAFNTKEELDAYQKHPAHQKIVEWIATVTDNKKVVDFEASDESSY